MRETQTLPRQVVKPRTVQETLIYALGQTAYMSFVLNHGVEACAAKNKVELLADIDTVIENIRTMYRDLQEVARYLET